MARSEARFAQNTKSGHEFLVLGATLSLRSKRISGNHEEPNKCVLVRSRLKFGAFAPQGGDLESSKRVGEEGANGCNEVLLLLIERRKGPPILYEHLQRIPARIFDLLRLEAVAGPKCGVRQCSARKAKFGDHILRGEWYKHIICRAEHFGSEGGVERAHSVCGG